MNRKIKYVFVPIISVFIVLCIAYCSISNQTQETLICSSTSPTGNYLLEAYRTEPGATVDFSIRVYIVRDKIKTLIYDAYHESDATIVWLSEHIVSINGKSLDLSKAEEYNWRDN